MIEIKLDKKAESDLSDIFSKIFQDKPNSAKEYVGKILSFIQLLKVSPEMGKDCRKKGLKRDCRVLYFENYTILYKVYKRHISIKRVLNSKQSIK